MHYTARRKSDHCDLRKKRGTFNLCQPIKASLATPRHANQLSASLATPRNANHLSASLATPRNANHLSASLATPRNANHLSASLAILLQASDWTFLYDLDGQLQFPIEADATSHRPEVVLFSRFSKTIVLLELTLPLEDYINLANDRKTMKYSALVTACEENCFKTDLFTLEVGCLGYCHIPSSTALKPSAYQHWQRVRSDLRCRRPPFALCMFFSFAEACRLNRESPAAVC